MWTTGRGLGYRLGWSFLMALAACLMAVACSGETSNGDAGTGTPTNDGAPGTDTDMPDGTIAIGANVAVTGGASFIGSEWERGIEIAVDAVNEQGIEVDGTRYTFSLTLEDNQTNPEQAITINQRLAGSGVQFIFGPGVSSIFSPAYQSVVDQDIMVFTPATTSAPLLGTPEGSLLFNTHMSDVGPDGRIQQSVALVVDRYSPGTVAIALPQDPVAEIHMDQFTQGFRAAGVEVVYAEFFDPEQRDFSSFIAAMRQASPDMVVVGYLDRWVGPFLQQAVDADFTSPVFLGTPGSTRASLENAPEIETYSWSVTTRAVDNPDDASTAPYRDAYQARFGDVHANTFWGLSYYDSVLMLAQAMRDAGTVDDLAAIAAAVVQVTDYEGRVLDLVYTDTHQAQFSPQQAFFEAGEVSWETVGGR